MKKIRYMLEAAFLKVLLLVFRILPLDAASATGGFVGRMIGPRLTTSRKAIRHLGEAMPELEAARQKAVIAGMWDNLGRVIAEYPHLEKIGRERTQVVYEGGSEALIKTGKPCIMIAAHLANWEISSSAFLAHLGTALDITYRAPNNPWVDDMLLKLRTLNGKVHAYRKSRQGGQDLIKALRDGRTVGILIDQKYNEGIAAPFFGRPAMTNPIFAQLGRKFDYPVFPAHIERTGGAHFRVTIEPPLIMTDKEPEEIVREANAILEAWIRKRPEQWLWLHRRWDSQKFEQTEQDL